MEIANVFEHVSKEKFRSAANKLLGECFILKKHKDTASDYNYILNNKDAFIEYFEILGYEVIIESKPNSLRSWGYKSVNHPLSRRAVVLLHNLRLPYPLQFP